MSEISSISNVSQKNGYRTVTKNTDSANADFSSYLTETKSLDDIFNEAAQKYNVPVNVLKAIGKAESDFRTNAVSHCGAQGIMQLMPKTAASLGVKDSFDPEQNIMGGAKYFSEMLDKFDGNTSLALAAYNAGANSVQKYGGIPPYEETQNYVVKVTNYIKQGVDAPDSSVKVSAPVNVPKAGSYYITMPAQATPVEEAGKSLDDVFSEIDYMKLLEMLLDEDKDDNKDKSF